MSTSDIDKTFNKETFGLNAPFFAGIFGITAFLTGIIAPIIPNPQTFKTLIQATRWEYWQFTVIISFGTYLLLLILAILISRKYNAKVKLSKNVIQIGYKKIHFNDVTHLIYRKRTTIYSKTVVLDVVTDKGISSISLSNLNHRSPETKYKLIAAIQRMENVPESFPHDGEKEFGYEVGRQEACQIITHLKLRLK